MNGFLPHNFSGITEYEPELLVLGSHKDVGVQAALKIAEFLQKKPNGVLGLATGGTPEPMYEHLVRLYKDGLDFSKATFFNLDEYVGLPETHDQSYHFYMQHHLFRHINADQKKIFIPNGMAIDLAAECAMYEQLIKNVGGIDLQVLGVGDNSHIGFGEPGTPFASRTHVAFLTDVTREKNARFFPDKQSVPTYAITMGIGTILEGREIILIANGASKITPIKALYTYPLSPDFPVTALRMHNKVHVIVDRGAFPLALRKQPPIDQKLII